MTHTPRCVCCGEPNATNLVLCEACERFAQESRKRWGQPLRFAKTLIVNEEPDS